MTRIQELAQRYRLQIRGVEVWVPYWINWDTAPYFLNAPFRGKATPGQLQHMLLQRLKDEPSTTAGHYRSLMRQWGLGVDCSGFAYYVQDQFLQARGMRLAGKLVMHRAEVLEAYRRRPERRGNIRDVDIAELTPLDVLCRQWHKHPAMITGARRLTDPATAHFIARVEDIFLGDMIHLTNARGIEHVAIVSAVSGSSLEYVSSEEDPQGAGGIRFRSVKILAPTRGLEAQDWQQKHLFNSSNGRDGVWRLKGV